MDENIKIARMYFYTGLFSIFTVIFYKLFYKTSSVKFQLNINKAANWTLTSLLVALVLSIFKLDNIIQGFGFLNVLYYSYVSNLAKSGVEFKFPLSIKFLKEE